VSGTVRTTYRRAKMMYFSDALVKLLSGHKMRRSTWAPGMCLECYYREDHPERRIWMHCFNGKRSSATTGLWCPTQTDIMAFDWLVHSGKCNNKGK